MEAPLVHLPGRSLSGRPLLATKADMALFAGRSRELKETDRALAQGFNVLVVGERGAGRTSFLRALTFQRSASDGALPGASSVYVRAAGLASPEQILRRVLEEHDHAVPDSAAVPDLAAADPTTPEVAAPGFTPSLPASVSVSALGAIAQRQHAHPFVVFLDDVDPVVGNALFGVLRDELWETRTSWVVTAAPDGAITLLAPPADAFFEVILPIDPLSRTEAIDLLKRRLPEGDQPRLASIARDGGHPREVIERARQVDWDSSAQEDDLVELDAARREWESILARLGRPARMLVAEMRDLGPVSASDVSLQQRMGWTRPRALQVLADLETAGLAVSASPPQRGPGRPRKIYRLLTPHEWAARGRGRAS